MSGFQQQQIAHTPASLFTSTRGSMLQRACACGQHSGNGGECAACRQKRLGLQRQAVSQTTPDVAPPLVHDVLRSSGQPLDASTRAFMEPRFGHDFSQVRVHTDARAAESARAVNALAYTVGRNVVFGTGQFAPGTSAGQRLMAHELTHVVQQRAESGQGQLSIGQPEDQYEQEAGRVADMVTRTPESQATTEASAQPDRSGISRMVAHSTNTPHFMAQTAAVLQRTPGQNAEESWQALVTLVVDPNTSEKSQLAQAAISRLLATVSGAQLINTIWGLFCRGRPACRSRLTVSFVDALEPDHAGGDTGGFFKPSNPGAPRYEVFVKNQAPPPPGSRGISLGGDWPGGSSIDFSFTHTDPESSMASTLHHELLHIWFIHSHRDADLPTGHGDVMRGEIEPIFLARLKTFSGELDALEVRLRGEAAARQREAETRQRAGARQPDAPTRPEPAPSPREESPTPSLLGGEVSLHGGIGGGARGVSGIGIVGADLIFGRIASLRLGARGVYLTPDHLLAGGSLGFRLLEPAESGMGATRSVQYPLFFDLEAGLLAEITPTDTARITNNLAVMGSAGVGQEFGRAGARFFWRVGGFVIVSDRGVAEGGATGGSGVRF